jgi:hypothetical protein
MLEEMPGLLIFHLLTTGLHMFKRGEVEVVKENREKAVAEAEDETRTWNPYQLQVLNRFEEMRLRSKDRWPSIARNLSAIVLLEVNLLPRLRLQTDPLQQHNQQSLSNHLQMPRPLPLQQSSRNKNKPAN